MEKAKVLAFLLCEHARKESDGKVSLHGLFDRIVIPKDPRRPGVPELFYVFYKIDVREPCTVRLSVTDPANAELGGKWRDMWRDSFSEAGPIQTVWALTTTPFEQEGPYRLELREELEDSQTIPLASMTLSVERKEKA